MADPKQPSGFVLAKSPSKTELVTLLVIVLGAAASCAEFLPAKYQAVLVALWAIVRAVIRVTGQQAVIVEAEQLGAELKSDVQVFQSKPGEKP